MGLFDWFTEKRRLRERVAKLEEQNALALEAVKVLRDDGIVTTKMLCSTLAAINVRMQAGEVWEKAFNFHIDKLPEPEQIMIREATLRMLHQWHQEGVEVNMTQRPVFDFPTPATESDFPQE